jgi:hypothetical protein
MKYIEAATSITSRRFCKYVSASYYSTSLQLPHVFCEPIIYLTLEFRKCVIIINTNNVKSAVIRNTLQVYTKTLNWMIHEPGKAPPQQTTKTSKSCMLTLSSKHTITNSLSQLLLVSVSYKLNKRNGCSSECFPRFWKKQLQCQI